MEPFKGAPGVFYRGFLRTHAHTHTHARIHSFEVLITSSYIIVFGKRQKRKVGEAISPYLCDITRGYGAR